MTCADVITFPSGISIAEPLDRASRFLTEEYAWYDSFVDEAPNNIIPFDLLVAVGMNAFAGGASVAKMRVIQQGMAASCEGMLARFAVDSELVAMDDVSPVVDIIVAATDVRGALSAVATKVLHRKRRQLFPIIDSVLARCYCSKRDADRLAESYVSESTRRSILTNVLSAIQADVRAAGAELYGLTGELASRG
jgi:hypothetical protein